MSLVGSLLRLNSSPVTAPQAQPSAHAVVPRGRAGTLRECGAGALAEEYQRLESGGVERAVGVMMRCEEQSEEDEHQLDRAGGGRH